MRPYSTLGGHAGWWLLEKMHSLRGEQPGRLGRSLLLTTILGSLFLACQVWVWWDLIHSDVTAQRDLFGFTFYMLTALHGVHVIAGLIPLAVTTVRAFRGRYSKANHDGVLMCTMYWHFLDVMWVLIFCNLVLF